MPNLSQLRTYEPASSVVFRKTKDRFGGLSNMAGGFPINVNGVQIGTSEALYQACRFPHMPEVQQLIISEASPMTAKMRSRFYRDQSREDWMSVRIKIMRWCLQVKLAQNWQAFSTLLLKTGDKPIVEYSRNDGFWGAQPQEDGTLQRISVLGRLPMELRQKAKPVQATDLFRVHPLPLRNFLLCGRLIETVEAEVRSDRFEANRAEPTQINLFDE